MTKLLISAFLFTIIWKISCGIALNCTFGMSPQHPIVGSVYQCDASILWDMENRDVITVVFGAHENDLTHEDVQGVTIFNQGLESFPLNIEQFFPNIILLRFPSNSLSYVGNHHLTPFPNLEYLVLGSNRLTSLDSYMFAGLDAMQLIDFRNNSIQHVGHDFTLPNTGQIYFLTNPCIDIEALTPDAITAMRFSLLLNCPPSISLIEDTLKSRNNWLTNVKVEVHTLVNRTDVIEQNHFDLDGDVRSLTNTVIELGIRNSQLAIEVEYLRQINAEVINEVTELAYDVRDLQQRNLQLTNNVTELQQSNAELITDVTDLRQSNAELSNQVADLEQSNVDLINRNSHLDSRVGFLDTRARYLEERVAVLENIIERKLGLNVDEAEAISHN